MINKQSCEALSELVKRNESIAGVMRELGLTPRGSNYTRMKKQIVDDFKIDVSHFKSCVGGSTWNRRSREHFEDQVLIENGPQWTTFALKAKIFELEILENACYQCGQLPQWNNKPLVLQLDHIDGNPRNNRLNNLRILCPNCHSQTDTYNVGKKKIL